MIIVVFNIYAYIVTKVYILSYIIYVEASWGESAFNRGIVNPWEDLSVNIYPRSWRAQWNSVMFIWVYKLYAHVRK